MPAGLSAAPGHAHVNTVQEDVAEWCCGGPARRREAVLEHCPVVRQQIVHRLACIGDSQRMVRLVEAASRSDDGHRVAPCRWSRGEYEVSEYLASGPSLAQRRNTPTVVAEPFERLEQRPARADRRCPEVRLGSVGRHLPGDAGRSGAPIAKPGGTSGTSNQLRRFNHLGPLTPLGNNHLDV